MSKLVVKFPDGNFVNIPANGMDVMENGTIIAWNDDKAVAVIQTNEIIACWLSAEKKN